MMLSNKINLYAALAWMSPAMSSLQMTARQLRDNMEVAFDRLDTNKDGVLTQEEFVNSCLQVIILELCLKNIVYSNILGSEYFPLHGKLQIQPHLKCSPPVSIKRYFLFLMYFVISDIHILHLDRITHLVSGLPPGDGCLYNKTLSVSGDVASDNISA